MAQNPNKFYILVIHHTDGTKTQYSSIFTKKKDAENAAKGGIWKKKTKRVEVIGFPTLKEMKSKFNRHHVYSFNNGEHISRELLKDY